MIPELGFFCLIVALFAALAGGILPLWGAFRRQGPFMAVAAPAAIVQCALAGLALAALAWCYYVSDFSVLNVAENSHSDKPLFYKLTGVWGNHEGSMLLWTFILTVFAAAAALTGRDLPETLRARALAVQSLIAAGFFTFIIFTSNPFARLFPAPLNGQGLNPLLQDPGLAFHPPVLYLGYVGFSMAFSFAIAALLEGRVDSAWARRVRPWSLVAWAFLTLGICGGSYWAYYTLGWGGWWYWDPTENASFMPWLAGTALLHSLIVLEKRETLKGWTVLLAIITFSLSLLGTFLVRSGVLTSVHAFATDPARGVFILALLGVFTGGSLLLFGLRVRTLGGGASFHPLSREGGLVLNNVFLCAAAATVFTGTLYPLFIDAFHLGKISVGAPYFNATFTPLMAPLLLALAPATLLAWKRGNPRAALKALAGAAGLAALAFVMVVLYRRGAVASAAGAAMAVWIFFGTIVQWRARTQGSLTRALCLPRAAHGMTIAHLGLAVTLAGIVASSAWREESISLLGIGDSARAGGYEARLARVEEGLQGPNYSYSKGVFEITRKGRPAGLLMPEKRLYDMPPQPVTHAAIRSRPLGDLYVVLAEKDEQSGRYVTRLYYDPLVGWIFAGAIMMALGGALAATDPRRKEAA